VLTRRGTAAGGQTMADRLNAVEKTIKSVMATAAAVAPSTGHQSRMPRLGSAFAA
jgi:hypothetical protein